MFFSCLQVQHWSGSCLLDLPPAEGGKPTDPHASWCFCCWFTAFTGWGSVGWFCSACFYCYTSTPIKSMIVDIFSLLFGYFLPYLFWNLQNVTLKIGQFFLSDSVLWVTVANSYSTSSGPPPPLFGGSQHVDYGEALLKMIRLASMEIFSFFSLMLGGAVGCCSRAFSDHLLKLSLPDIHHDWDVARKMWPCVVLSPTDL